MRIWYFVWCFVLLYLVLSMPASGQIAVNTVPPYNDPNFLVQDILLGNGVSVSNISYYGDPVQIGFFNGTTSNIGLDSGIVLSTGDVRDVVPGNFFGGGIPVIPGVSGEWGPPWMGTAGNNALLTLANSVPPLIGQSFTVSSINDAAVLEFDFVPMGDSVEFRFVFGSDEYLTWINSSYNDAFGFFIAGPGITGTYPSPAGFPNGSENIALVPNSSPPLPITISSVNPNINSQYYIDNPGNTSVALNGFTTVLTARAAVVCGQTYHIALAIGDGSDSALDSGVFLEAGSFSSGNVEVSATPSYSGVNGDTVLYKGCGDVTLTLVRFGDTTSLDTVLLDIGGTAINGVDYSFIPDSLFFLPGQDTITLTFNPLITGNTGTETIIIEVIQDTSMCGSQGGNEIMLYIFDPVPLLTSASDTTISCPNDSFYLGVDILSGISEFQFEWSTGDSLDSIKIAPFPGIYYVTITDACQSQTVVDTIEVFVGLTTFDAGPDTIACSNSLTMYASASSACVGAYTVSWSPSAGLSDSTILNPVYTEQGTTTYSVTFDDGCGCQITDSVTVTIGTKLIENPGNITPANCLANDGVIAVNITGGDPPYSYSIDSGATFQSSNIFNGLPEGIYSIYITDTEGCELYITDTVESVNTLIIDTTLVKNAHCFGDANGALEIIANSATPPFSYNVDVADPFTNSHHFTEIEAGVYYITVEDAAGCLAFDTAEVTSPPKLLINVSNDTTICPGTITGINVPVTTGGTGPPYFFTWSNGYGNYRDQEVEAGIYTVIVTDNKGCSATETIAVENYFPLSMNALTNKDSLCEGDTLRLIAAATGGTGNYDFEWFPKDHLSDPYIAQPLAKPDATMNYTVVVKDQVCDTPNDTAMVSIKVNPVPELIFGWDTTQGCTPLQVEFTNNSTHMNSASWDFGNGTVVNDISPAIVHSYGNYGVYDVSLKVTSSSGCEKDTVLKNLITAHPDPIADFTMSPQPTTVMESEIMFTDMSSIPRGIINQWDWEFSGLGLSNDRNPIFQYPSDTGTYPVKLAVTSGYGCKDETLRYVRIGADFAFYIPNAFSPNGDGRNELFKPRAVGVIQDDYVMFIFDRWGELVYQASKFNEGWDGKDKNGGPAPQGVYVYRIIAKDYTDNPSEEKGHSYMGHVTLIR